MLYPRLCHCGLQYGSYMYKGLVIIINKRLHGSPWLCGIWFLSTFVVDLCWPRCRFYTYSGIIMDKESIKYWHLLTSINDVFTIWICSDLLIPYYKYPFGTIFAYILLYHFTGSNSSLVCNENNIYMWVYNWYPFSVVWADTYRNISFYLKNILINVWFLMTRLGASHLIPRGGGGSGFF